MEVIPMNRKTLIHRQRGFFGEKRITTACGQSLKGKTYSKYWSKVTCKECLKLRVISAAVALIILSLAIANAQGRKPDDPATWGDVQNVQKSINTTSARQSAQESAITDATEAANASMEMKYLLDASLRILDTKHTTFELFNSFDARHGQNFAFGGRITLKLGKSYEEREMERLRMDLDALKRSAL